jgi:hypothetical protein
MTNDLDITDVCHEQSFDEDGAILWMRVEESVKFHGAIFGGLVSFSKNCPPGANAGRGGVRS